jgi:DNA-3-methyladenine glycosylase
MHKLPRSFYLQPTLVVAKKLLGKTFVRKTGGGTLIGKIAEVEAYLGETDPASHAFHGITKRNEVMFHAGGYLYVYFTYGMHFCANVVTEEEGKGRAVLIRAVEPLTGIETMKQNRNRAFTERTLIELTNGPAKFCQAFGIERGQNGIDLLGDEIFIIDSPDVPVTKIAATTRIGIKTGTDKKWRFYIKGNVWVSK